MKLQSVAHRKIACSLCRLGMVASAVMLVMAGAALLDQPQASAALNAGPAEIVGGPGSTSGQPLANGGSATVFGIRLPVGAACTGDSASGGYRVQSYVVPASVDPNTLTFGVQGPVPVATGANYRQPLFTTATTRYVNITTGVAPTPGGGGPIPSTPGFNFAFLGPTGATLLPAGTYNVGLACTLGFESATQLDKYWNVQITIAADPADQPSGITWTVADPPATTTTTTTVAETTTTTTTTTPPPGPTTTPPPAVTTTSTLPGGATTSSTTSTTLAAAVVPISGSSTGGGSSTGSGGGSSTGGSPSTSMSGTLPRTGSSPMAIFVWGALFLVLGRMAILLGRKPEVRQVET